eukprot:9930808-Karenia_brevis.AAC.1
MYGFLGAGASKGNAALAASCTCLLSKNACVVGSTSCPMLGIWASMEQKLRTQAAFEVSFLEYNGFFLDPTCTDGLKGISKTETAAMWSR